MKKKSDSRYVLYKQGAYSSITYISAGLYIYLSIEKYYFISYILSVDLLILGIASFLWWATQNKGAHRLDITLYSSLLYFIGFFTLIVLYPIFELDLSLVFILVTLVFFITVKPDDKSMIQTLNFSSVLISLSLLYLTSGDANKDMLLSGLVLGIIGFCFKFADSSKKLPKMIVGTAWFHFLSSISITLITQSFQ